MPERPANQSRNNRTADSNSVRRGENERGSGPRMNDRRNMPNPPSENQTPSPRSNERRRNPAALEKDRSGSRANEKKQENPDIQDDKITVNAFNGLLWCAFSAALLLAGWKYLSDDFFPFAKNSLLGFSIITILGSLFCLFLPIFAFSYKYPELEKIAFGKWPGRTWIVYSVLLGVPAALIFTSIHNLTIFILIKGGHNVIFPAYLFPSGDLSALSMLLAFLTGILIPSIATELYFRGVFFAQLPPNVGMFVPIVLSAFFYALYMQNPVDFLPYFLQGILFAYLRKKSSNILCSIITAIVTPLFIWVFSSYYPSLPYYTFDFELGAWVLYTAAIALVSGFFILLILIKSIQKNSRKKNRTNSAQTIVRPDFRINNKGPSLFFTLAAFVCVWLLIFYTFP